MSKIRKIERDKYSGVSWSKSIDVPEIPLSYNFTGIRKTVIPNAFIIPASVSIRKFEIFKFIPFNEFPPYSFIVLGLYHKYMKKTMF